MCRLVQYFGKEKLSYCIFAFNRLSGSINIYTQNSELGFFSNPKHSCEFPEYRTSNRIFESNLLEISWPVFPTLFLSFLKHLLEPGGQKKQRKH
jgi:hypothetical protein